MLVLYKRQVYNQTFYEGQGSEWGGLVDNIERRSKCGGEGGGVIEESLQKQLKMEVGKGRNCL